MAIKQDLPLVFQPASPVDSPDARPKGLLDQLLEEGTIHREFVMPGTVFEVRTTARFDPGQPCFFRCAVLHDGDELSQPPWAPIFRNLTEAMTGAGKGPGARPALARQALECHLSLCHRVERQLEEKGALSARGRAGVAQSGLKTPVSPAYAVAVLIVAGAAGAWYGFERWQVRLPGPVVAQTAERPLPAPTRGVMPAEIQATDDALVAANPLPGTDPAGESAPGRPASRLTGIATAPSQKPFGSPRQPAAAPPPPRRAAPRVAEAPPRVAPPPVAPPPVAQPAPPRVATAPSDPPPRSAPAPRAGHIRVPDLITEIVAGDHQLLRLEAGAQVYRDASIRISEIPRTYRGLPCVTTASRQGDTEQGILLQLKRPARVYVAHDRRVKKKPQWLASFRATGDTLRALEVDRGRTVEFAIFHRDVAAGAVALGSNTRAKMLTRKVREFVPRKSLSMYLVCVAEANGQVPSSSASGSTP